MNFRVMSREAMVAGSEPIVSVLMPVYNAERYVAEAVESILAQTYADFEFIIVDDGSTDGSLETLKRYAQQDERIRLVSRPNTGIVGALNEGLALARGEFIARMDADDISLPERFALEVAYLNSHPECIAVGCQVMLTEPGGEPLRRCHLPLTHQEIDRAHMACKGRGATGINHAATMMRVAALVEIGAYREGFLHAEDLDLFLRLAEAGHLANLPEVLYHYRQHLSSTGATCRQRQVESAIAATRDAYRRRALKQPDQLHVAPAPARASASDCHRVWAWWALRTGNVRTARKHALITLRRAPFSISSWRVLACAIRGH